MEIWQLALIIGGILAGLLVFIITVISSHQHSHSHHPRLDSTTKKAHQGVEHIFNSDFQEELQNRGRQYFEKILSENAMFLQQDLRLTTSQLNDFMKQEIKTKLDEELTQYEASIAQAKELALESINKTQAAVEQQRQMMGQELLQEYKQEKARLIRYSQENLADIVSHYVVAAIGDQIDLNDQLKFIISDLEMHKEAIAQDINDGL